MNKQSFQEKCQQEYYLMLLALSFFTRVPVRLPEVIKPEMLHKASRYFALVGLFIGAVSALIFAVFASFLPISLAILISMACSLLLTGAFHEDGWADVWDGFGGGWTVEQKLNIMKDSRLGTYGAAALFFILMLKYQSLVLLSDNEENSILTLWYALILAHTLSRAVSTSLIFSMTYVSEDAQSKVKPLAQHLSTNSLLVLFITSVLVLFTLLPAMHCLVMIACLWVMRQLLIFWFNRQLGGFTGDCLGAAQQILEVAIYIILLVLAATPALFSTTIFSGLSS
jgi:adenosylcobinamide-GDP ribazoletransferase